MGRKKKFSDEEKKEMALNAIQRITGNRRFILKITCQDIYDEVSKESPNVSYYDLNCDVVKKIIIDYEKSIERVYKISIAKVEAPIEAESQVDGRKFYRENKEDEEAFVKLIDNYNLRGRQLLKQSDEIKKLIVDNQRLLEVKEDKKQQEENERLKKQISEQRDEIELLKRQIEKYKDLFRRIDDTAALLVINDTKMGGAIIEEEETIASMAKRMSYLKEQDRKAEEERRERLKLVKKSEN